MAEQHYYQTPGHVIAAGIALSLLDILVVAFRFKARRGAKQPLKTDDWLLLPATVCLQYFMTTPEVSETNLNPISC